MKNLFSLVLVLSASTVIASCSEKSEGRRPDAIYQKNVDSSVAGGSSSINDLDSPISDSIGSTRLFSNRSSEKKSKLDEVETSSGKVEAEPKQLQLEIPAEPQQQDREVVAETMQETPQMEPAQETVVQEVAESIETQKARATATEVVETNLNILNMRPIPENEGVQVINVPAGGVPQQEVQKYIRQQPAEVTAIESYPEVKEEVATEAPVESATTEQTVEYQAQQGMPASLAYKIHKQNASPIVSDKQKVEEPSVIEKVADFFTPDKVKEKNKDKTDKASSVITSSELPSPDAANVGECMAKVTSEGEYKEVEEEVLIKEATTKTVESPAEYNEIEEEVIVTPEKQEEIVVPAKYRDEEENVLVSPGKKVWKKVDNKGDLMQLVEQDAVYKKVIRKVLVEEEKRETKITPAVTKKVKRKVLVKEASVQTIEVPAEYKTVKRSVAITPDKVEWLPAVCENKLDKDTVKKIQGALVTKGYDIRLVDGSLGPVTKKALLDYQKTLGFGSNAILQQTIDSLGLAQ